MGCEQQLSADSRELTKTPVCIPPAGVFLCWQPYFRKRRLPSRGYQIQLAAQTFWEITLIENCTEDCGLPLDVTRNGGCGGVDRRGSGRRDARGGGAQPQFVERTCIEFAAWIEAVSGLKSPHRFGGRIVPLSAGSGIQCAIFCKSFLDFRDARRRWHRLSALAAAAFARMSRGFFAARFSRVWLPCHCGTFHR